MSEIARARAILELNVKYGEYALTFGGVHAPVRDAIGKMIVGNKEALELMRREPPIRPMTERQVPHMTAEKAEQIRQFAKRNPGMGYDKIAKHFDTNIGRVSEAMHGKR